MAKSKTLSFILDIGVVPIVRASSPEAAIQAVGAIYRGGIRAVEITMTVPGALRVLEQVADQFGDRLTLGAGTVLDAESARACMLAGAEFFVTPTLRLPTIEICHRYSKVVIPGALTPTEVLTAWDAGADLVKVFPCGNVGGPKYIRALKAPLPQVEMVPTGGVNLENTADFLRAGASAVAVGSEMVNAQALAMGNLEVVEENARRFLAVVAEARRSMKLHETRDLPTVTRA
ncbi:MAG TPA: bifunctional 4-hydroxy-2-oxoglutarate aldolase/2-dehydro-3-deoxy-phosphogluconate aldolase [Bryobacterales bacterium]|nr:bifunctional 4-hydroxy-2-oxoglutarate aldolase/2-dehydro-3-deoxy-phosphogluconate aldolase [Bryobacterales bacterium]